HPVCFFLMQIKWKKFGWMTFFFNLSIYIAFLLCFTSLVVIMRSNEERFCGLNPTNTKVCTSSIIMKGKRNSTLAKNSITKWISIRERPLAGKLWACTVRFSPLSFGGFPKYFGGVRKNFGGVRKYFGVNRTFKALYFPSFVNLIVNTTSKPEPIISIVYNMSGRAVLYGNYNLETQARDCNSHTTRTRML
ncbi:hypothetical protein AC249_AIPGENE4994, partial [Exaiptasia diaphana]